MKKWFKFPSGSIVDLKSVAAICDDGPDGFMIQVVMSSGVTVNEAFKTREERDSTMKQLTEEFINADKS